VPTLPTRLLFAALAVAAPLGAQQPTTPLDSSAGRIIFSVFESFADSTGQTHLVLRAETERPLHCWSRLGSHVSTHGDTVTVGGWFTSWGGGCITDEPARPMGIIPLPVEPARRVLEIVRLGAVDRYRLTVTGDAIQVRPIGTPRVSVLSDSTLLWRFPRDSFTFRCGTDQHTTWMCAEVEHLVADLAGITPIDLPPTGRDPYAIYGASAREPVRLFRAATPADYGRLTREVQGLYDLYAGPRYDFGIYTRQRFDFDVSIIRWTGQRWNVARPVRAPAMP
jgi:hypothetical protein